MGRGPVSEVQRHLLERARCRIPGGVNSNVRLQGPRVFFARGKGAWLWDVDGNDYVDYLLGQGPNFLGHAPDGIIEQVAEACRRGMVYGAQHELEVEAAELLCETLGWADLVRLGLTGTEAVQAALRLARAATGRTKIVRFEGHYHGWLDNVLVDVDGPRPRPATLGQLASHLDDSIVLPWNDLDALRRALDEQGDQIAAVLMEPMMLNAGSIFPRDDYLAGVRSLCDHHDALLIFDEVITGFRLAPGGAAEHFGVTPDLATYGKAMAGGWPVAAVAGRGELMERFGTGEVNHSGTFNASVMACAAIVATLESLLSDPPYGRIERHGEALMAGLREAAEDSGVPLHIQGAPCAFHVSLGGDQDVWDYRSLLTLDRSGYERLASRLTAEGVWVAGRGIWYVSAAHGDQELEATLDRVSRALAEGVP